MGDEVRHLESQLPIPKWVLWVAGALVMVVLGFGIWDFGFSGERQDEAWRGIRERGVIVVATDASYPPFSAVDANGNLFGFDVDLAEAIARRLGVRAGKDVRAEFENITYDALLPALVAGRDDAVISAFVAQPERLKEVSFTRPYFVSGTVAVIHAAGDRPRTTDPGGWRAWAAGKTLAVEYGAGGDVWARQWLRQAAGITVLSKPDAQAALAALAAGEADAALVDAISAYDFLRARPDLALAGQPLDPEPYVIAVSSRSRDLFRALEDTLAEMEAEGELVELKVKWFGEAVRQ